MRIAVGKRTLRMLSKRVSSLSSLRRAHPVLGAPPPAVCARRLFFDNEGFSTVGMVLALLITLSLVFTSGQVYRVQAASASVQNAADAAALAAEGPVAEFYVVVRVCDAVVLSLTLTGVAATGIGLVATCVPPLAALGAKLVEAGRTVFTARDSFATKATDALNKVQRALPYLSAAEAISVLRANSGGASGADYVGFAVLLPEEGEEISIGGKGAAEDALSKVESEREGLADAAARAEEAAKEADAQKAAGYAADCGNNPGYCMYERASVLAGMDGASNPLYESVDAWSFSVALERARAYYKQRRAQEAPEGNSVEEQADSALRARFYDFAQRELAQGYVRETEASFKAYFPELPRNTSEMRQTTLYTDSVYPVVESGGVRVMHAWSGCPEAAGATAQGSIQDMEAGGFSTCPSCRFSASSLGKVAAASTSIANGFEHHYAKVAEAARAYQKAREVCDPLKRHVQGTVASLLDGFSEVLESASKRIEAKPPGRTGVVVLAADVARTAADAGFVSSFVSSGKSLGVRAAVSASTLVSDSPEEGKTVLTSLLDGVSGKAGNVGTQAGSLVLSVWSKALSAYADGHAAIRDAVSNVLNSLPLVGASGLGTWAADALEDFLEKAGLAPAKLDAPKPVLVNTAHVANAEGGSFAERFAETQRSAVSAAESVSGDVFSAAVSGVEDRVVEGLEAWDGTIEVARIDILGPSGPSIPIEIVVPPRIVQVGQGAISSAADRIRGLVGSITGVRQWE